MFDHGHETSWTIKGKNRNNNSRYKVIRCYKTQDYNDYKIQKKMHPKKKDFKICNFLERKILRLRKLLCLAKFREVQEVRPEKPTTRKRRYEVKDYQGLKSEIKNGQIDKREKLGSSQRDEVVRIVHKFTQTPETRKSTRPLCHNSLFSETLRNFKLQFFSTRFQHFFDNKNRNLCSFPGVLLRLVRLDHLSPASHIQRQRRVVSSSTRPVSLTTKNPTFAPD